MDYQLIGELVAYARANNCSDLHLTADLPPVFRKDGEIFVSSLSYGEGSWEEAITSLLTPEQSRRLEEGEDLDFAYTLPGGERQRVNVYYQKGRLCAAIRILRDGIPDFDELMIPPAAEAMVREPRGLILVTGPTGSGKSTTLAAMIDRINEDRKCHILTAEEPIEYVHNHKNSIVHQREVGVDVPSFAQALRGALREDPDVILVGEMRDLETIAAAVTAAETGHLVLSTLHTTGAANTIDRIVDVFPQNQQNQIRTQLAMVLQIVVSQQLVPTEDDRILPAFEIMVANSAIRNMIRDNKTHQVNSIILSGREEGMIPMDQSLLQLVLDGAINRETALNYAMNKELLEKRLPIDL